MIEVEILRCWKGCCGLTDGLFGEFYVKDSSGSKTFIFVNEGEMKCIGHFVGRSIKECLAEPTQKVKDAILKASEAYLEQKKGEKKG